MCSVPSQIAERIEPVQGVQIVPWEMDGAPPQGDEIAVAVIPQTSAPWVRRLADLPGLRAVIVGTAGYDHVVRWIPPGVPLANAVGVHDTATAEIALALILAAQRDIPTFVRDQDQGRWPDPVRRRGLADRQVTIVGYGGIGRALARRLVASEATVTAVASRARAGDEFVEQVRGIDDLPGLLGGTEILVVAVPNSAATQGLVDAQVLAGLPDDALVVNVGRGPAVDTDALIAECSTGRLRAALDVTDPEPLPADHPLWSTPGVLISPHTGGFTEAFLPRIAAYVRRQIVHFRDTGELQHVVAVGAES